MTLNKPLNPRLTVLCPLQPGEPCTLCHPDAHHGPQDCPTVVLVMADEDLRSELTRRRVKYRARVT